MAKPKVKKGKGKKITALLPKGLKKQLEDRGLGDLRITEIKEIMKEVEKAHYKDSGRFHTNWTKWTT